ncbi:GNAT family N-acetyltransferase [Phyllobacterium brassicacearum]|uniref:GNAT family N-acetyltransferase n=1 Tax=Phyllobacterium brassicacearum TaxID=314235 RepID=A0A2P7BEK2_9HYPH|nr:GNAT family N-acetyltransferase [Phyllobacterium brassicacearum]PSH64872.1 GNAT family N-acetyltransferase [Phyllobacterium brassicacearum]TDQ22979.1 RimJ/RimL family protein N-acetyltransferase [Phyllobacterium brassicacearum]
MIPILETERLILRPHNREDFESVHAMWQRPEIYMQITGKPSTREQSWARLLRYAGLWPLIGYGFWAVEERASRQFVGELGFANFERQIDPPFGDAPEMGWVLSPEVHGMGFGSEALSKVVAWGDAFFKHDRALCIISPENAASQRIAKKNGFRKIAETTYTEEPVWMFERRFRR